MAHHDNLSLKTSQRGLVLVFAFNKKMFKPMLLCLFLLRCLPVTAVSFGAFDFCYYQSKTGTLSGTFVW
jgi:hypothetical protein